MKKKEQYRVMQRGNEFFLQVKKLLFWRDLKAPYADFGWGCYEWGSPKFFVRCWKITTIQYQPHIEDKAMGYESLKAAKEALAKYETIKEPIYYRGHKIVHTINDYYIDVSINAYIGETTRDIMYLTYDKSLNTLEREIDNFEREWVKAKTRKIFNL